MNIVSPVYNNITPEYNRYVTPVYNRSYEFNVILSILIA